MAEKWRDIKDFAAERGFTINAIKAYIKRQGEKEAIPKKDLKAEYGFMAVRVGSPIYEKIDKKYPMPKTVEVVHDEDLQKKYEELLEKSLKLTEEVSDLRVKVAEDRGLKALMDSATRERDAAIEDRDRAAEQAAAAEEAKKRAEEGAEEARNRADEAEKRIEEMRNAGLWRRIRNRW